MAQMYGTARWSSTRVQEKWFAGFILVKYLVEIPMREEKTTSQPAVGLMARKTLKALEQFIIDQLCRPFPALGNQQSALHPTAQGAESMTGEREAHTLK